MDDDVLGFNEPPQVQPQLGPADPEALSGFTSREPVVGPSEAPLVAHGRRHAIEESEHVPCVWISFVIRSSKTGFAFRRQLVIGNFIVDFACTKVRLAVEIDGAYHEERALQDARRDRAPGALGWRVLRVVEEDIFADLETVVGRIVPAAAPRKP